MSGTVRPYSERDDGQYWKVKNVTGDDAVSIVGPMPQSGRVHDTTRPSASYDSLYDLILTIPL